MKLSSPDVGSSSMSIPAKDSKFSCGKQYVWFGKYVQSEMVLMHEVSLIIFKFKENNRFWFFVGLFVFLFNFRTSIPEHHFLQKQKPAFPITIEA